MLAREEVDAALILAFDPVAHLPNVAAKQLKRIPTIVIDPTWNLTAQMAHVVFPTSCYGVDAAGTYYRMDNVPIRLRAVFPFHRAPRMRRDMDQIIEAIKRC